MPMKTITLSMILTGLIVPSLLSAQEARDERKPPGKRDGKRPEKRERVEVWKKADADADDFLTESEFSGISRIAKLDAEKRARIFRRLDKNADGKLAKSEFGKRLRNRFGPKFWELDGDKNGGVSFVEFQAGDPFKKFPIGKQEQIFKRLDSDGDGQITPKDRPQKRGLGKDAHGPQRKGNGRAMGRDLRVLLRDFDVDGDGALDFPEYQKAHNSGHSEDELEDRFLKLDRNGDKKLSAADLNKPKSPAGLQEPH